MEAEEFVQRYPRVWHVAEAGSWPEIRRHGLLSVSALLDLHAVHGEARQPFETARRAEAMTLEHPQHGRAVVRDQRPLHERVLSRTLVGMTPRQWYELLNAKVFFWLSFARVERHRAAALSRHRPQELLTVDTAKLLGRHGDRVELSPINSGATFPLSRHPRGRHTFQPLATYPWAQRRATAPREPVVELTVGYAVRDIAELVIETRRLPPVRLR